MNSSRSISRTAHPAQWKPKFLTPEQMMRIDEMLAAIGEYGEIHLIVQRGELRYINKVESFKAWDDDRRKPG